MKFCVKCGKSISKGIFCETCSQASKETIDINMQFCDCGKYFSRNAWLPCQDDIDAVQKLVKNKYGIKIDPREMQFDGRNTYEINTDDKIIFITICKNKCNLCSRKGTYFEGILQIRCKGQQNLDACLKMIEHELKAVDKKGIFVNKVEEVRDGADLYITSQRYVQELARKINKKFGGIIKINSTLFSRNHQTSRDIFRVNSYVELPPFSVNDVIKIDSTPVRIVKIGKQILGRDLMNDKQVIVDYKTAGFEIMKKYLTNITKVRPEIEALNPLNYQPERIRNPGDEKVNDEVTVVVHKGLYIVRKN